MNRNIARIRMSSELLKDALAIPVDTKIVGISLHHMDHRDIIITIEHPDLIKVRDEVEPIPEIVPMITRDYAKAPVMPRDYLTGDWNQSE